MSGWDATVPASAGHRFAEQLAYLSAFPGYTAERAADRLVLWYRRGPEVCRLDLRAGAAGLDVVGDVALARHLLSVDAPPLPPAPDLPAEPSAHRLLRRHYGGIRPVLFADPCEGVCWAILGQQITLGLAARLKQTIALRHGRRVPGETGPVAVFPSAPELARLSVAELRAGGVSRQKAEALLAVAGAVAAGSWDPAGLRWQDEAAALERLLAFRGIGRWTAQYVLLRVAGCPDVLPAADAGLQRAWARLLGRSGRVSAGELQAAGCAWRGWRSDFAFALWLDNLAARPRA